MAHDPLFERAELVGVKWQHGASEYPPVLDSPGQLLRTAAGIDEVLPQPQ
jgi:hypothetical protein